MNVLHTYLGDAVYASFDGFGISLHLDDHNSPPIVFLEPEELTADYGTYSANPKFDS